ncbi:hypothetical protein MNBD_ACTINO02-2682 [hydrothermal vent metagenome]|uniref:DUF1330 domain-containing protein n=1 Tax=hydrothermal vent metagenome TaxID=652676 RepID=A0A3B0RI06_9ZZZZ
MATLLVTLTAAPDQDSARGRYVAGVQPLLKAAGGRPVKRLRVIDAIVGSAGTSMALVMDFDSADAIAAVFASAAYQALVDDRDMAFSNIEILITEDAE